MDGNPEIRKKTFPPIREAPDPSNRVPLLLPFPTTFLIYPQCCANAKTFNARPQHEKTREKHHQGSGLKGKSLEDEGGSGRGEGNPKKAPSPSSLLSLRPRRGALRLRAQASHQAGRGLKAALDPSSREMTASAGSLQQGVWAIGFMLPGQLLMKRSCRASRRRSIILSAGSIGK